MAKNPYNRPGGKEVGMGYVDGIKEYYRETYPEYSIPKYVLFIERALNAGYKVKLYRPASGVSKYVSIFHQQKRFKIRFSNHKPIEAKEARGDCDFFVGVTNFAVTTSEDAWKAMLEYFQS